MKHSSQAVKVFAPATVANVGVGFDILGFALEGPGDEVLARWTESPGLKIGRISGTKKSLPKDIKQNTAGYAALQLLKYLEKTDLGIQLEIHKKMPFGSGMGSSAASAAAGVMAVNELLGRPLTKRELVPFAVQGESVADGAIHGDNVIPALLGGIILIRDNASFSYTVLPSPPGIYAFVIYPQIEILTKDARAVLSDTIPLRKHVLQSGNLASFVSSLYTMDLDLMKASLEDHIIEPQRAKLIPHFDEMKRIALNSGAMNYTISGAGPSMFGFCQNSVIAESVVGNISVYLDSLGVRHQSFISQINTKGSYKM